jgi:hypothetical protein
MKTEVIMMKDHKVAHVESFDTLETADVYVKTVKKQSAGITHICFVVESTPIGRWVKHSDTWRYYAADQS